MKKLTYEHYIYLAVVLVLIFVAVLVFRGKKGGNQQISTASQTNQQATQSSGNNKNNSGSNSQAPGIWTGVLKTSDNLKKGNLMLVTGQTTVYISTSRDFSLLVGKRVEVNYEGTLSNFVLGNISVTEQQ